MFRAIGLVITLFALSQFFSQAFVAFEQTTIAVLETVETAATVSTAEIERVSNR